MLILSHVRHTPTQLFLLVGAKEFLPSNAVLQLIFGSVCTLHPEKCANVLSLLCGYNEDNINSTRLGVFLSYTPAGRLFSFLIPTSLSLGGCLFATISIQGPACKTWRIGRRRCV